MGGDSTDDVIAAADGAAEDLPFRELAKHLATPCWISDAEGEIVWVNDAWLAYTGLDVETIRAEGLKPLHDPDVYGDVVRKWMAIKAAGVADEMDFPLRGKDGRLRPFAHPASRPVARPDRPHHPLVRDQHRYLSPGGD